MNELSKENVDRLSKSDWKQLTDLIPIIENTVNFEKVEPSPSKSQHIFHHTIPSEIVLKFIKVVSEKQMIMVFDWMNWDEGHKILEDESFDYDLLDLTTIIMLITTIVRNDRFCDGFIISKFQDGTILKILHRIVTINNQN